MAFLTILRKFLFFWEEAVKRFFFTKAQNKMYLWVLFCSGVHRTQYRTPMNPQFANVGEVVVYHEINGEKVFFLVKWLSTVYLKAVN